MKGFPYDDIFKYTFPPRKMFKYFKLNYCYVLKLLIKVFKGTLNSKVLKPK